MHSNPPLVGLNILDLGRHPSSALASMVLADFGAQVSYAPSNREVLDHPAAPMLLRGKRVLQPTGSGYQQAQAQADVIITTLGPDDAPPLAHPRLIHLNISGWGTTGPYAHYPMNEGLVAAKSGRMANFEGQNPRPGPGYVAVQVATFAAAQIGVQSVLAALLSRARTGIGQRIETSLLQALTPYDTNGLARVQLEARYPNYLPKEPISERQPRLNYQPVQAKDGRWIQMGNLLDHLFRSFLEVAGLSERVPEAERKKQSNAWSPKTTDMMRAAVMKRMRERTADEWLAAFKAHGNVAAALYQSTQQSLDDPDLTASQVVVDGEHPTLGRLKWLGPAAHMEKTPAFITAAPKAAAAEPLAQRRQSTNAHSAPLAGVTVLEFASIVATPTAVSMLADLGARVIKIEPIGGDPGRRVSSNMSAGLGAIKFNVGKQSICIELKSPQGREILDKLLPRADLIAHNFRPGVPEKLGFGYERAKGFNPKIVWLAANGYGPAAPSAKRPCSHPIAGAQCGGALYQAGAGMPPPATDDLDALLEGGRRLMRANEVNPDPSTSMIVATAAMLGLYAAKQHGIGQRINVDMMLANAYANFDDALRYAGKPERAAVDAEGCGLHALHRLYPCAEGWVFVSAADDESFQSLCAALGIADDPRFRDAAARRRHDGALAQQLAQLFRSGRADEWEDRLGRIGCVRADGPIAGEFWLHDVHVRENGFARLTDHPRYGQLYRHGPVMSFSKSEMRCGPGTLAGQDTDTLLKELGYDEGSISRLRADQVVWSETVDVHQAFG